MQVVSGSHSLELERDILEDHEARDLLLMAAFLKHLVSVCDKMIISADQSTPSTLLTNKTRGHRTVLDCQDPEELHSIAFKFSQQHHHQPQLQQQQGQPQLQQHQDQPQLQQHQDQQLQHHLQQLL